MRRKLPASTVDHSTANQIYRKQVIARMGDRQRVERWHSDESQGLGPSADRWPRPLRGRNLALSTRRAVYKPVIIVPRHPRYLLQHRDERIARLIGWDANKLLRTPRLGRPRAADRVHRAAAHS